MYLNIIANWNAILNNNTWCNKELRKGVLFLLQKNKNFFQKSIDDPSKKIYNKTIERRHDKIN